MRKHLPAVILPVPNTKEVEWFKDWYYTTYQVDLPIEEARKMLTHLAQFYFLTKGHELYDHNQRVHDRLKKKVKEHGEESLTPRELDDLHHMEAREKAQKAYLSL